MLDAELNPAKAENYRCRFVSRRVAAFSPSDPRRATAHGVGEEFVSQLSPSSNGEPTSEKASAMISRFRNPLPVRSREITKPNKRFGLLPQRALFWSPQNGAKPYAAGGLGFKQTLVEPACPAARAASFPTDTKNLPTLLGAHDCLRRKERRYDLVQPKSTLLLRKYDTSASIK